MQHQHPSCSTPADYILGRQSLQNNKGAGRSRRPMHLLGAGEKRASVALTPRVKGEQSGTPNPAPRKASTAPRQSDARQKKPRRG